MGKISPQFDEFRAKSFSFNQPRWMGKKPEDTSEEAVKPWKFLVGDKKYGKLANMMVEMLKVGIGMER
jgi:hypothetical protein